MTEIRQHLLIAAQELYPPSFCRSTEELFERLDDWQTIVRPYGDWRHFIPDTIVDVWERLPLEAKLVAFCIAWPLAEDDPPD